MANHIRFFAITADDVDRARAFYGAAFGWTFEDWGPPGFCLIHGAGLPGAIQERHEPLAGDHPRSFELTIGVEDIDVAIAAVAAAGGTIVMPKTTLPAVGTLIHFLDSEGNRMGAMQYEEASQ